MKPSEFWAQICALPEQARQAFEDADELRSAADALCEWARIVCDVQRKATALADDNDLDHASLLLDGLAPRPDLPSAASKDAAMEHPTVASVTRQAEVIRTRKRRSDAGKPRGRKTANVAVSSLYVRCKAAPGELRTGEGGICRACESVEDGDGPSANPADVKAEDAARVKLAGLIRQALDGHERSSPEPVTIAWLMACTGLDEDDIRSGLGLLSLASWRMKREGDSKPVEVWGTVEQFAQQVGRISVKSGDRIADTVAKYQCSEFDAKRVWMFLDPMRST